MLVESEFYSVGELLRSAVYMLMYKGKVMYIGQSTQPLIRLYTHMKTKKAQRTTFGTRIIRTIPFDDIWFKPCFTRDLEEEEKRLIQKHQPKFNLKHNNVKVPNTPLDIQALLQTMVPDAVRPTPGSHPTIGKINRRI